VIEQYGRGCVLLFRIHHCLADGMALLQVLRSIIDREPEVGETAPAAAEQPARHVARLTSLVNPLTAKDHPALRVMGRLIHRGIDVLFHPGQGLELAEAAVQDAATLGKLLLLESDSPTVFKGPLGVAKRVVWSDPLPVKEIKAIGHALGGSVTEVLLTAITGALRRYLQQRDQPVANVSLHVSIPVNLHRGASGKELGNRFSLNFLALPIDRGDPVERLLALKQRLDALNASRETEIMVGLMQVYGLIPGELGNQVVQTLAKKVTAVFSSVPGPLRTICYAGKPICRIMFWVPQSGHLGLGISFITYAGSVTLGVVTDAGLVPDPGTIVQGFQEEVEHLKALSQTVPVAESPGNITEL